MKEVYDVKALKNRQGPLHIIGIKQRKNTDYEQLDLSSKNWQSTAYKQAFNFWGGLKNIIYYSTIKRSSERYFFEIFPLTVS